jgi:hypothetical protein
VVDQAKDGYMGFLSFEPGAWPRLGCDNALSGSFVEAFHPTFLAVDVERAVAADCEQPFRQMPIDRGVRLRHQAYKRILHHVARPVGVTQQTRRIAQELGLELLDGGAYKRGILIGTVGRWRVRIHVLLATVMTCSRRSS